MAKRLHTTMMSYDNNIPEIGTSSSYSSSASSSSSVKTVTLDDLKDIDMTKMDRPLNVLVTIHDIKPFWGGVYVHGLGLWINYIIEKYLVERNIPHKLYTKSVKTSGGQKTSPEDFIKFVKRHNIDVVIPSDVTDTMFLSKHHQQISEHVNFAVASDVKVYEMLEDKWDTYNMAKELDIFTPHTELFDRSVEATPAGHQYPFFLKVASGTNAGRGVWHCKNDDDLKEALKAKEITKNKDVLLLKQTPVSGDIITAQIVFEKGNPVGFFFCQSVQSENLAGMGDNWINSQSDEIRDMVSDIKVELTDAQWEELHKTFIKIGNKTMYHGMMDIEFIVNPTKGICLLECNPRFSGGLHTTLSNPGFLDLYFDVVNNTKKKKKNNNNNNTNNTTTDDITSTSEENQQLESKADAVCGNYSVGVDLKARLGDFDPTRFYMKHALKVLSLRHWFTDSHITYRPASATTSSSSPLNKKKINPWLTTKADVRVAPLN